MKIQQLKGNAWFWLTVLLAVFILINFFIFSFKPKPYPSYVSDSPSPTGVKAFYTYLNTEMGSGRWAYSPSLLPNDNEKKLLVMEGPSVIPDKGKMSGYINFMKAGNTILLLKDNPKGMFDLDTEDAKGNAPPNGISKVLDQNHTTYRAELDSNIRLTSKSGDHILLHDEGGIIALERSFGKGQLIVAIAPEWMMNGNLLSYDHLPLMLSLINENHPQTVWFDEYIHRKQTIFTSLTVYPKWFLLSILQGILLVLLWLWYKGKRFGPIFIPREDTVRFSDEGIRALSSWYLRGKRYHDSIEIQADYLRLLLQERWAIPYGRDWKDLSGFLERKWPRMAEGEIPSFLNGLTNTLEKDQLSKQEYLLWSKKLDQFRKEVEEG